MESRSSVASPGVSVKCHTARYSAGQTWLDVISAGREPLDALSGQLGILPLGSDFPVEEVSPLFGLYAAVTFAITVVTMPLLTDRDVNSWVALQTSIRAVSENPVTMVAWAMVIMALTGISFITGMLGFLFLYPLMGHASWHVYRELVDASELPTYTT